MEIGGTYPMLYAFFGADGGLDRAAMRRQVNACLAAGAAGVAVLGLGTETHKLGQDEKRQLIGWVLEDVGGRAPVMVTIAEGNVPDMANLARYAEKAGAAWLTLQPPRPPASGADLVSFFARVASAVSLPVAIQNAPEFLGIGMSADELAVLNRQQPNVSIVKAESTAVGVARIMQQLGGRFRVFNGRAGLELTDNYRAGVHGMIPGVETIDLQVAVEKAMRAGDEARAEELYRQMLPAVAFAMQGLMHLLCYGKLIAAHRLGLAPSADRAPADRPTPMGAQWAARFAADLGPLPGGA